MLNSYINKLSCTELMSVTTRKTGAWWMKPLMVTGALGGLAQLLKGTKPQDLVDSVSDGSGIKSLNESQTKNTKSVSKFDDEQGGV